MEEKILSKEELIKLFQDEKIIDTGKGWLMDNKEVEIIALHDVDPKFLQDVTNAKLYKLIIKGN
ncbi:MULTISPECIES: hypothetical protein [Malaciobacter]|jgi:hypothetical protein|uniref:Uncharacterized protein n=2 Tax=Malaciobacter TaxID=2321114 RepID=A0AB36ZW89_9BACT|nr:MULTISPECIES: hypothetical protein [Malaciobacter]PHO08929.1 hypothetical protein CPG37_11980 [Malaciobacter canalis]PPK61257.1 hypothetical protein B0F89_11122 [Malaciobacter marinus]QEE32868.1 hypothetical protein ACAN_1387 [Malaciobacter canalis]SKB60735.1 hypothetical protein SAMN06295997_12322 [Malaciobacter marinus]